MYFSGVVTILFCLAAIATSVLPVLGMMPPVALILSFVYIFLALIFASKTWETIIYVANAKMAVKIIEDPETLPGE